MDAPAATARLSSEFPAVPASVPAARAAVAPLAEDCGADSHAVALCVSEAVANAVLHAYRDGSDGAVHCEAWIDTTPHHRTLWVAVEDDGVGMHPRSDSPGLGLGLSLIAAMSSRLEIHGRGRGSSIQMAFDCPAR
jgi:anti-sigma regulatory factor (Ser/Thr protein kinase)